MAPKKHSGKKRSRRMKGGMTTGQWGTAVYGDSSSQHAAGAGSNVIRMNDPNAPQMKGGDWSIGDIKKSIGNMMPGSATPDNNAPSADEKTDGGILDKFNPFASTEASTEAAAAAAKKAEEEAAPASVVTGGKGKRKSATKRRKSHKKKGKSSKKRAHKRR